MINVVRFFFFIIERIFLFFFERIERGISCEVELFFV